MVKRRRPHRHDKSFTMGAVGIGASGLLPTIFAAAVAVAMIIALGLELGVLYDYRVRDFKAVTDGTAFLNNGSQCLRHATSADVVAYYGENGKSTEGPFKCGEPDHKEELGKLLTASVHQLYHIKTDHAMAYEAARRGAGVFADNYPPLAANGGPARVSCADATAALHAIANQPDPPDKCADIYTSPTTQADCETAVESEVQGNIASTNGVADVDTTYETAAQDAAIAVVANAKGAEAARGVAVASSSCVVDAIVDSATAQTCDLLSEYNTGSNTIANAGTPTTAAAAFSGAAATGAASSTADIAQAAAETVVGVAAANVVVGVAAAEAKVATDAGGTVGDGGDGDAAIAALATPITDLASATAASAAAGAAYSSAVSTAAITDQASATTASGAAGTAYTNAVTAAGITDQATASAASDEAGEAYRVINPTFAEVYVNRIGITMAASKVAMCPDTAEDLSGLTITAYKDLVGTVAANFASQADTDIHTYNLYLQCVLSGGLGNLPTVATADNLAPVPTASRGGTLDIPIYQRTADSATDCFGYLKPAYTPPPMLYGDFNCSKPRQARAKVMYGARLGWSLFGTVPCVILIVYLGVDAIFAALCFLSRYRARKEWGKGDAEAGVDGKMLAGIATQLSTIQSMRGLRLGVSLVGFLVVVILKAVYDWAPWVTGTVLPQATTCGDNGWQTEQTATVMQFIVIVLIFASIIALPLSQIGIFKELLGSRANNGSAIVGDTVYPTAPGTARLYYWFLLTVLGFIVLIAFEAADGVAWGISWAGRQLDVYAADLNSLDVDKAATLVEEAATSAVLCAVSTGVLLSLAYARWLFTSYGKQNCLCSIIWLGCVIAGLIPIFITWGFKLVLNPDEQEVLDKCDYLTPDSFEAFLCTNRGIVFSIALLLICTVFLIMFCCWQIKVLPTLFQRNARDNLNAAADSGARLRVGFDRVRAAKEPMGKEKIPLLSLRVRH